MQDVSNAASRRRPRFRRADPPAFRLTDDDLAIIRLVAQHRFLRSIQIAALVSRSLDRTNDRLCRLFHAGFIERPKAQLDHYATKGSSPMVYALGDLGAQLLALRGQDRLATYELARNNREAGRPFIDHQLEISDFHVSLQRALQGRTDMRLIPSAELIAAFPEHTRKAPQPLSMRVTLAERAVEHEIGIVPDFAFGLRSADGRRRCFMVEIDRGTMPILRSDLRQTSFARKMRGYLAAYAEGQHVSRFGWKAFRVLTVTTDDQRLRSMQGGLRRINVPGSPGSELFFFTTRDAMRESGPFACRWHCGTGAPIQLV
jgi:hypothetical protein